MIGMGTTIFLVNPVNFGGGTSYLLDTYSASAAYSLRQLKTGVTNVVRVRRSGDLAESDFTADEVSDGTLLTWVTASGTFGSVVKWYDQSGGGNDVTQATAVNAPVVVSGSVLITKGGLPSVLFDGSNDYIDNFTSAFLNNTSVSYFSVSASGALSSSGVVHSQTNATTLYAIRTFCDARTTPNRHLLVSNSTPTTFTADLSTARNDTNQRLLSSFIDASKNMSAFDNGATGGTATYTGTPTDNNGLQLGRQGTTTYLNGYIQEFIAFNTDESANRTDIESDIDTHYWGADLLLDTYSGAAAAYSLRKLSKFTTNVVRVRRSSDNAESDFTATEITDGTLTTWTGANSGFVVTWYDQSGGGNNVTQSTGSNQPQLVSGGVVYLTNGKPKLLLDGTNDYLTRSNLTALNAYPFSIFGVGNNDDSAELAPIVSQRNTTGDLSGCNMFLDRTASAIGFSIDQGASNALFNYPSTLNNANQRIQSFCISSGGDGELWLNGTSQETIAGVSAYATALTANLNIGKQDVGPLDSLMGIQEVIIFNTDETTNQSDIETNINNYYSAF